MDILEKKRLPIVATETEQPKYEYKVKKPASKISPSGKPGNFRTNSAWGTIAKFAPLITLVLILAIWQFISILGLYPPYILPSPEAVITRFEQAAQDGQLLMHTITTLWEAGLGFILAALVAGALCYPIAHSQLISALLSPILAATQAVPLVAVAPLLVIWFGFGLLPKVITCTIIVFFPLLLNAVSGLKSVDKSLSEAAAIFGASALQTLWLVELPLALPTLLTGVKIGFTLAITGAVVGEFISANAGLGYLLNLGRGQFDTALVFVALLTLTFIAIVAYGLISWLEKHAVDWQ